MMFTELAVGYELSPDVRLELAGGYAERGGRSVGTVDVMMTALSDNPRKWIVDPSLGLGLQKRSEWGGVRLTVPVQMRAGCRFTPGFEAGVNIKTFLGNRRHIMSTAGVFIAFRM